MQYLYLIKCQQFYKIGVANDVKSRLAQLATGNPFDMQTIAIYAFDNASVVEASLHQAFAGLRKKGEWFQLLEGEIDDFNLACRVLGGQPCSLFDSANNEEIQEAEEIQEVALDSDEHFYFTCDEGGNHYVYCTDSTQKEPNGRKKRVYKWVLEDPRTQQYCKNEAEHWLTTHKCRRLDK